MLDYLELRLLALWHAHMVDPGQIRLFSKLDTKVHSK